MIVAIGLPYAASKQLTKLGREKYLELRTERSTLKLPEWKEDKEEPEYWYADDLLIDLEDEGALLNSLGVEFTIKRMKSNYFVDQTFEKARYRGDRSGLSALHVHIPNIALLTIDEVDWMEDACTQALQSKLDDGWRILAVCPPAMQRRPDYILGRTKERS